MTKTITLLFAHGAGLCKEIWEPITSRLKESPLLQDAAFKTEVVTFDFKYHGASRDESETPEVDLTDPLSPRVYHPSNDLTAWTTVEMLQRLHDLKKKNPNRKLIGIGHSMGACALCNSEIQQPGSFDGLILFEPVFGEIHVDSVTDFLVSITLQRESSWYGASFL
ncbi:Serine protease [Phytophthora megakarya]|uniref:Serine protease n=1 Tax=Phytophthora megakarya TaxID=4795 RepID=A0A225UBL8_9STRA|nr:Serine protease [Phytophthora megakarya]